MKHKLDSINKNIDYRVPEGYFENLPLRIQQRIETEKKVEKVFKLPVWSQAIAASILLIITFVLVFSNNKLSTETLLAEVSEEALIAYLEEIEIDEYDIVSAFSSNEEVLSFEGLDMLNELDLDDVLFDNILLEYNLEKESLEI